MTEIIRREMTETLANYMGQFRVVILSGPRQAGKTTFLKSALPRSSFVSLEDPTERNLAQTDPRFFLDQLRKPGLPVVIDEAQRAPELFSYIQLIVDADDRRGQFVLSGSQNFALLEKVTQSLAGRAGILHLLTFSLNEFHLAGEPALDHFLWRGRYPEVCTKELDAGIWYQSYIETYIERDVRQLLNVKDLDTFRRFVRICASRVGQIIDLEGIGNDCGVTHPTIKSWLSVLESSFLIRQLAPYFRNFGKRLIKRPKLYFVDTGVLCALLQIRNAAQLATHPLRGHVFESFILSELTKHFENQGVRAALYFWRDRDDIEIDFVYERGQELIAIEAKSSATPTAALFEGLRKFKKIAGSELTQRFLVYGGRDQKDFPEGRAIGWESISTALQK